MQTARELRLRVPEGPSVIGLDGHDVREVSRVDIAVSGELSAALRRGGV